jgi:hypothetical protein
MPCALSGALTARSVGLLGDPLCDSGSGLPIDLLRVAAYGVILNIVDWS